MPASDDLITIMAFATIERGPAGTAATASTKEEQYNITSMQCIRILLKVTVTNTKIFLDTCS